MVEDVSDCNLKDHGGRSLQQELQIARSDAASYMVSRGSAWQCMAVCVTNWLVQRVAAASDDALAMMRETQATMHKARVYWSS